MYQHTKYTSTFRVNLSFLFSILLITFISCSKAESGGTDNNDNIVPQIQPQITLSATSSDFSSEGGTKEISLTTTDAWTASVINDRADTWCSVNIINGVAGNHKIKITATANETPDDRTAIVIFKSGATEKTLKISQKQKDALTITASKFEIGANGGVVNIEIKANINFEYTIDESAKNWIKYEGTKALQSSTLTFNVSENDDAEKREAKIYIKSDIGNETVTIYQAGAKPTIIISNNEFIVSPDGETISVEVASNVNVTVKIPSDIGWITENATRGISTNTYYFNIAPNDNYEARNAEILFTNQENNLSEIIKICQTQKDAIVIANNRYDIDNSGDRIQIEVRHNIDFDIDIACDWITRVETRALESKILTFDVAKNFDTDSREGIIKFISKDGSISQTVKVCQAQADALVISEKDFSVMSNSGTFEIEIKTNVTFEVSNPNVDWLRPVQTRGLTTHSLIYEYDANTSYNSREAKIIVTDTKNNKSETITITQAQKDAIVVANSLYYFEKEGGHLNFKVLTDADITVNISDNAKDWILQPSTRAIQAKNLNFEIASYNGENARVGGIVLSSGNFTQKIKIIQLSSEINAIGTQIEYRSNDENIVIPADPTKFGATLLSNVYFDGTGILTFDDNISAIGENAFNGCTTLTHIEIPDGITSIGASAFAGCSSLAEIKIPDSVTEIGSYAFYNCSTVTSISIPDSVTEIGGYAFGECTSITSIKIPENVTKIEYSTFTGCVNLTNISIPDKVTKIGSGAFNNCNNLTGIIIPEGVTEIGSYAFNNCNNLTGDIIIPEGVTEIGDYAFYECSSLSSITIPSTVTDFGINVFVNCTGELTVNCNIPIYKLTSYGIFNKSKFTKVTIGEGVTKIADSAFENCNTITNISIPSSVTEIGSHAFYNCTGELTINCNIPNNYSNNEWDAPFYRSAFHKVTIGEGVTKIGKQAFYASSSITNIIIPSTVIDIGLDAFRDCIGVTSIYCRPTVPPSILGNAFIFLNCTFYVPIASLSLYQSQWSSFSSRIVGY